MRKILLLITVGISIVSAERIRRDEPSVNQALLESGKKITKEFVMKLEEITSNLINANSTENFLQQSRNILDQVKSLANTISQTTQEWLNNTSVQELREIASNSLQEFKNEHPEFTTAVTDSIGSLNRVANDIILQLKLVIDDKEVKEISDTLIDSISSSIKIIKDQLEETTQTLTKTLKKDSTAKGTRKTTR